MTVKWHSKAAGTTATSNLDALGGSLSSQGQFDLSAFENPDQNMQLRRLALQLGLIGRDGVLNEWGGNFIFSGLLKFDPQVNEPVGWASDFIPSESCLWSLGGVDALGNARKWYSLVLCPSESLDSTPVNGQLMFNGSDGILNYYSNGAWVTPVVGSGTADRMARWGSGSAITSSGVRIGATDTVLPPGGSAALPPFSFYDTPTTGMFQTSAGANSIGFSTAGTRRSVMGTTGYTIEGTSYAFGVEGNTSLGTDTTNTIALNGSISSQIRFGTGLTVFYVRPLDRATTGTAYTFNIWGQDGKDGGNNAGGPLAIKGGYGKGTAAGGATNIDGGNGGDTNGDGGPVNINGGVNDDGGAGGGTVGAINIGTTRGAVNIGKSGGTLGFYGVTAAARSSAYSVANPTTDRALDVTGDTLAQVAQVLGTLIADLQTVGIIG